MASCGWEKYSRVVRVFWLPMQKCMRLGFNLSSLRVRLESERRQMKQCWIKYVKIFFWYFCFTSFYVYIVLHYIPTEIILPQRTHTRSLNEDKAFWTLEKYETTFLELNKLCPRANSLYAFIEAIDLLQCRINEIKIVYGWTMEEWVWGGKEPWFRIYIFWGFTL